MIEDAAVAKGQEPVAVGAIEEVVLQDGVAGVVGVDGGGKEKAGGSVDEGAGGYAFSCVQACGVSEGEGMGVGGGLRSRRFLGPLPEVSFDCISNENSITVARAVCMCAWRLRKLQARYLGEVLFLKRGE